MEIARIWEGREIYQRREDCWLVEPRNGRREEAIFRACSRSLWRAAMGRWPAAPRARSASRPPRQAFRRLGFELDRRALERLAARSRRAHPEYTGGAGTVAGAGGRVSDMDAGASRREPAGRAKARDNVRGMMAGSPALSGVGLRPPEFERLLEAFQPHLRLGRRSAPSRPWHAPKRDAATWNGSAWAGRAVDRTKFFSPELGWRENSDRSPCCRICPISTGANLHGRFCDFGSCFPGRTKKTRGGGAWQDGRNRRRYPEGRGQKGAGAACTAVVVVENGWRIDKLGEPVQSVLPCPQACASFDQGKMIKTVPAVSPVEIGGNPCSKGDSRIPTARLGENKFLHGRRPADHPWPARPRLGRVPGLEGG